MTHSPSRKTPRLGTAAKLLGQLITDRHYSHDEAARKLTVPPALLDEYLKNEVPMPLDRQLALAQLLIDTVPALARAGHRLRGQVEAAIAYGAGETQRHSSDSRPRHVW